MKGPEFKAIRESFGLNPQDWMYELGYGGNKNTLRLNCERYENGEKEIPLYLARYLWLLQQYALSPFDSPEPLKMPRWPDWPGYHFDEEWL